MAKDNRTTLQKKLGMTDDEVAKNLQVKIEDNVLVLRVPLDVGNSRGTSKSGKSVSIATTNGNVQVRDMKVGLNVYRPIGSTVQVGGDGE